MSNPRRRILRFPSSPTRNGTQRQRHIERLRGRLERDRLALARWLARLKRTFTIFTKLQRSIVRTERQLQQMEEE